MGKKDNKEQEKKNKPKNASKKKEEEKEEEQKKEESKDEKAEEKSEENKDKEEAKKPEEEKKQEESSKEAQKQEQKKQENNDKQEKDKAEDGDADSNKQPESNASILSILTFLSELREKRRNVSIKLEALNASGYGPKAWNFQAKEKFKSRYTVVKPGERAEALVVRQPLIEANFKNIDELHQHFQKALEYVIGEAFTVYTEPSPVAIDGILSSDPEELGIPYADMCMSELPGENVASTIQPYCVTRRMNNPNYSEGFIAEGLDLRALRDAAFRTSQEEARPMRDIIIAHEETLLDGTPNEKPYRVIHPNDLINLLANPFNLNLLFDHLPVPVHYSSDLVIEALMPEISVTPLSASQLMINSAQSTAKLSVINTFAGINERPVMDKAMGYFVASLICPGSIIFSINFDDIPKDDIYLRGLAACAAKVIFSYNHVARWNSLDEASVRVVESALVRCGLAAGILDMIAARPAREFPLNTVVAVQRAQLDGLNMLQTQDVGTGWRESGGMRFAEPPPTNPYLECQTRQLYVTPLDDLVGLDEETINGEYAAWNTRVGVHKFLSCLARGRIQRTPMNGVDTVFDVCAHRLFRFFISVNNYNRENWYSSLRLSEMKAQNMFTNNIEMPAVCEIGGRTILYMLKSLDETSIGKRVKPYTTQLNIECGMMRDCIESYAKEYMFNAVNAKYGIDPSQYTRRERGMITHPKEGPLAMMLEHTRKSGYAATLGNFASIAHDMRITDLYIDAITMILDNAIHFGVSESVILWPTITRNRVQTLRDLAHHGRPYTNVYRSERADLRLQEMGIAHLQRSVRDFSAKENLYEASSRNPLLLAIPAPYEIKTTSLSNVCEYPIGIKYDKISRANTMRTVLEIKKRTFSVAAIDLNALQKPDTYLADVPTFVGVHASESEFRTCVETLTEWLTNINRHMNRVQLLATKNVKIIDMLTRGN